MVLKEIALRRLRKEADYEEKLTTILADYFLSGLEDIKDIDSKTKNKIKKYLTKIRDDSFKHNNYFEDLINLVLESGENNF